MIRVSLFSATALLLVATAVRADINGFGNFSGFSVNIHDNGPQGPAPIESSGGIELITGGGEARSIIGKTPQNITHFTASFTWQPGLQSNVSIFEGGATFVMENVVAGAGNGTSPVGSNDDNLGYGNLSGDFGPSMGDSVAVSLETIPSFSALYSGGLVTGGSVPTGSVNLGSTDPINVTLAYDGLEIHETLFDPVAQATYNTSFTANLTSLLGSSTAYVGFTGGTGAGTQTFSNFQFTSSVPEPATLAVLALGGLAMLTTRRRPL